MYRNHEEAVDSSPGRLLDFSSLFSEESRSRSTPNRTYRGPDWFTGPLSPSRSWSRTHWRCRCLCMRDYGLVARYQMRLWSLSLDKFVRAHGQSHEHQTRGLVTGLWRYNLAHRRNTGGFHCVSGGWNPRSPMSALYTIHYHATWIRSWLFDQRTMETSDALCGQCECENYFWTQCTLWKKWEYRCTLGFFQYKVLFGFFKRGEPDSTDWRLWIGQWIVPLLSDEGQCPCASVSRIGSAIARRFRWRGTKPIEGIRTRRHELEIGSLHDRICAKHQTLFGWIDLAFVSSGTSLSEYIETTAYTNDARRQNGHSRRKTSQAYRTWRAPHAIDHGRVGWRLR